MQQIDRDLIVQAKRGDEAALAALIARMMPALRKGAAVCAAPGLDYEDALQEGLIGLFNAVHAYDTAQSTPFASYAAVCIVNAQQDARRRALRKKHAPLNFSVPLPEDAAMPGPEELAIADEAYTALVRRVETLLSPLERQVLLASLDGAAPAVIARRLGCTPKVVQNALARARRKLRDAP